MEESENCEIPRHQHGFDENKEEGTQISYQYLNGTPESSTTKGAIHTPKQQLSRNNQTQDYNQ